MHGMQKMSPLGSRGKIKVNLVVPLREAVRQYKLNSAYTLFLPRRHDHTKNHKGINTNSKFFVKLCVFASSWPFCKHGLKLEI